VVLARGPAVAHDAPRQRTGGAARQPHGGDRHMLKEFKKFAMRGNVMDMAIGIILGAAFGKIVASAVKDVIMPPIGMALGGVDFKDLAFTLQEAAGDTPAVTVNYGLFINAVIDFLIVAFVVFVVVKGMNKMKKAETPPDPTEKKCDHCCTNIPIAATRCPNCTSELKKAA
jgi:large conductance mechanosensitive channel